MQERVRRAVALAAGSEVRSVHRLGGGDVAESFAVDLADGRRVFAKTHRDPPPGAFVTEAAGLEWLAGSAAVPVPEVLGVGDEPAHLVLAWVEPGGRSTTAGEAAFGRSLAALHAAGAPTFGREDRRPTGSRSLPNDPCATWIEFYRDRRLVPLAAMAARQGALPERTIRDLRRVAERLDVLGGPPEPPARLHGDLWAGNRLVDAHGVSWLIDPAAHGGHREFDLAMTDLFGGFGREVRIAYDEVAPLADGWRERVPLHQLAPLVVHAIKFGGGYPAAVRDALDRLV